MEEEKVTPMWKLKLEIGKKKFKDKASGAWNGLKKTGKKAGKEIVIFTKENPAAAVSIAGSTAFIVRKAVKAHEINVEERRRDLDYYDPRNGKHTKLYKRLSRKQQIEVDRRYSNHESYIKIFDDMGIKFH